MSDQPETESPAERIIQRIAEGESMRKACEQEGVKAPTFCLWVTKDAGLAEQYARAREIRAEVRADQIDEVAELVTAGLMATDVARIVLDARKWAASKLAPKRYGDRIQQEVTGANGGPVQTEVFMAPDEAYKRLLDGAA
jgi:hypothetical protein